MESSPGASAQPWKKEREVDGVRKEKERLTAAEGLAEIQIIN